MFIAFIRIPKGSSSRIALSSLGFGAVGFGLVTTGDRNRLFPVFTAVMGYQRPAEIKSATLECLYSTKDNF